MEIDLMTAAFGAACFVCAWLITKPQKIENQTVHTSLERINESIEKLTQELRESREDRIKINNDIENLFHRYEELYKRIDEFNKTILQCRGDGQCYKK